MTYPEWIANYFWTFEPISIEQTAMWYNAYLESCEDVREQMSEKRQRSRGKV
jgi:hypothetical protein